MSGRQVASGAVRTASLRLAMRTALAAVPTEATDKVAADAAVLEAGGTVFHAGPLSSGPLSVARRTVGLGEAPRRLFPVRVSRATVAAAMLDEAEDPAYPGAVAVPLERQEPGTGFRAKFSVVVVPFPILVVLTWGW